jgi:hypothetical protein
MSIHPLAGSVPVDVSAGRIRRYRWLEERLLRILGGWLALTPELPVKLLFGRHVWDCAQHADLWGRRLLELRASAQRGEPPGEGFAHLVDLVDGLQARHESIPRVVAVYRVLKPHLITAYEAHLAEANPVYEPPTRRILARCLDEERRHVAAGAVVLGWLTESSRALAEEWESRLSEELRAVGGLVAIPVCPTPRPATPDPREDLVGLDSTFDPRRVDPDLVSALEMHQRALVAGDSGGLAEHVVPSAREAVLEIYRLAGAIIDTSLVACARVGAYRFVKLVLRSPRVVSVVQLEWRRSESGWRIVNGELVRSEPLS